MAAGDNLPTQMNGLPSYPGAGKSYQIGAASTPMFIVNGDSKTATADADDPYSIALDTPESATNADVNIFPSSGLPFLRLYHLISGATNPTVNPVVAAFGFVPTNTLRDTRADVTLWDAGLVDSTNYDIITHSTLAWTPKGSSKALTGYWKPLYSPIDDTHLQTFDGTPEIYKDATTDSGKALKIHHSNVIYRTEGCPYIMVTVATASTDNTAGMIAGALAHS